MTAELELWQSEPVPFQQALAEAVGRIRELAAPVPDWSGFDYVEHGRELDAVAVALKLARDLPSYREALERWTASMETAAARRLIGESGKEFVIPEAMLRAASPSLTGAVEGRMAGGSVANVTIDVTGSHIMSQNDIQLLAQKFGAVLTTMLPFQSIQIKR